MNIVCIPYHDWRKITKEGSRTRDSHFIEHMAHNDKIDNIIVLNRPTSYSELLFNGNKKEIEGELMLKRGNLKLLKVGSKQYVIDYITSDLLAPVLKKRLWFFDSFGYDPLIDFYKDCLHLLGIKDPYIFTNNIFSISFVKKIKSKKVIFDAYDNLVFFPHNAPILNALVKAYHEFVTEAKSWTTNSHKNMAYYKEHYGQANCHLIKNGVDIDKFQKQYTRPADMQNVKSPVIGFGGKITHLFDTELFNYCTEAHPDKNFVVVGQILDKEVFNKILKRDNVFYLGDKHYEEYPSYVTSFDIGIVPYVTSHLESGVDSIKMYEYIAAGLRVVGTQGAGMPDMSDYIYIADGKERFSEYITAAFNNTQDISLPETHTWKYKGNQVMELLTSK